MLSHFKGLYPFGRDKNSHIKPTNKTANRIKKVIGPPNMEPINIVRKTIPVNVRLTIVDKIGAFG